MLTAISIGLPRLSLTLSMSLVTLRTRKETFLRWSPNGDPAQPRPAVGARHGKLY